MAVVFFGILLRLTNLGTKDYWRDEAQTSLWVSGYSQEELTEELLNHNELSFQELQKYQRINAERRAGDTIRALASEDPKHSPLYYGLIRLWAQLFGDSVSAIRCFSAIVSIIALACFYWVGAELFQSRSPAALAGVLMAASPFYVLYAQEAREYSLWSVTILLSSGALLMAMQLHTPKRWAAYAITVALGLYSHPFFVLVIIAHCVYVASPVSMQGADRQFPRKRVVYFVMATAIGLLAFVPWAMVIFRALPELRENTAWASLPVDLFTLCKRWLVGFSSVFIDTNGDHQVHRPASSDITTLLAYARHLPLPVLTGYLIRLPILLLVGYSLYFIFRRAPKRIWLFILMLVGTPLVFLMLPDLVLGRGQSSPARYLIPSYIGAQLSVAYLLIDRMRSGLLVRRRIWKTLSLALVVAGLVSCAISSRAETWWNKSSNNPIPQVARMINQSDHPIVICSLSSTRLYDLLSLSHRLGPGVRLRIISQPNSGIKTDDLADVFLLNPSKSKLEELEHKGNRTAVTVYIP